jgi:hypothetical protein
MQLNESLYNPILLYFPYRLYIKTVGKTIIPGLLNLQDAGGKAKPYQIKQLLALVERYNLSLGKEE